MPALRTRHATILALVAGLAAPALAERDIVFKNAGGAPANELHVVFADDVSIDAAVPPAPFGAITPSGHNAYTLSGAPVAAGGEVSLHVGGKNAGRVERWWWASDGRRIGSVQHDPTVPQPAPQFVAGSIVLSFSISNLQGTFTAVADEPAPMPTGMPTGVVVAQTLEPCQPFEIKLDCGDDAGEPAVAMFAIAGETLDSVPGVPGVEPVQLSFGGDCAGAIALTIECIADPNDAPQIAAVQPADVLFEAVDVQPLKLMIGRIATTVALADGMGAAPQPTPGAIVDDAFLKAVHGAWGTGDPMFDLDNDGYVDANDFRVALVNVGREVEQPAMRPLLPAPVPAAE